ncbi:hypothetical protein C8R44DRAFT_251239 [Mycena epipterygia]|nr:hypothetical protein C8R44DRAFT_251239 [Mycena epipterygia]
MKTWRRHLTTSGFQTIALIRVWLPVLVGAPPAAPPGHLHHVDGPYIMVTVCDISTCPRRPRHRHVPVLGRLALELPCFRGEQRDVSQARAHVVQCVGGGLAGLPPAYRCMCLGGWSASPIAYNFGVCESIAWVSDRRNLLPLPGMLTDSGLPACLADGIPSMPRVMTWQTLGDVSPLRSAAVLGAGGGARGGRAAEGADECCSFARDSECEQIALSYRTYTILARTPSPPGDKMGPLASVAQVVMRRR